MHPLDPCLLEKTTTGFAGLAIAPSNNQVIYLGGASHAYTDNIPRSPLYKSIDGGTTWTTFTNFWFTPTSIAVNPTDPNKVWVGFDSFAETTQNSGIGANRVKYFDGTNWIPRDAGLPPLPINALVYQPGSDDVLYAGTDVGVFKWNKSNNHWDCFSGNLPVTIVSDLEIDACSGKLYAATYGRGIWKTDLLNFSPIIPTFSLTSSINTCEAVLTATIANQSSAIHNFVWSTGEIVSSPTAMTNAITVHQSGTYTVTISGGGTCASTASIAVTVFEPTVTITPSTTQPICANTLISIDAIVNLTVPTSWHWSTPSGATTASIQVTPQAAGATTVSTTTYTVTVTDGATCTATSSIDITVFNDCCPVPPNFKEIEPRGTTTSQIVANIAVGKLLPMATAATTMQKIVISYLSGHNLLIDEDYTFFNSDIHIGTACGITIGAGKTLTLLGCTIESCSSSLWDKIEILDGGILTIDEAVYTDRSGPVRKPTTIKDSDSGIYTEQPNASISLKNTVFQDDYISVFINGSANPTPLPLYFQCNSTVFKGTPLVGSPKINVAHTGEHFPIAGLGLINSQASINPIHLDPIDGVIGGSTSFTDLSNGIISYNSTLNIGNCYFANIHDFDRMGRGNAIYAQTNGLVNFFGYQAMHHFENCDYGILANGAAIYANSPSSQGVSMRNVKYGIATTNTAEIAIERSTIAATYRGIEISGNPTNANISLNRNTISVNEASAATPSNSAAISISGAVGAGAADFSNTSITDNIITIENATTGIALTNIIGSTVKNNEVNCMEPNSNSEGILVARSPQTIVDNNTLQGSEDLTATADYTGIRIEQSAQTQITCNTTDLLKTGIKVEGICTGSQIKGNYFGEHASALWYSPTATTGPQERNGNVWTSQYNGSKIGAFNENTVSITPNLYTVNQIDDNGICIPRNSNGSPSVNPLSWFNTSPLCNKICNTACLSALNAAMNLDAEIDIALNLTKYDSAYEEGLKWADKRYLLNLLEKKTELLQDPVFMAFIDSMAVITEGKFQNIEKNTKEVITPTNQIKTLLQQYQNAILLTNQNLLLVDSLLSVIKDTTQIRALEVQYVNYKMQYIQLLSLETELMQTQDSIIKTNLPNLVLQNNALTHTAQYEENEKIVNDIFYTNQLDSTKSLVTKYRQDNKGRFTAAQKSTLLSIASQCPFEGGNAVFAARAMVSEFDKTYYNDRVICLNRGILWRTAKPKTVEAAQNTLWNITFAPNPTQGTVTIGFSNKHPKGSIQLFDVYGRLLQTNQFTETNTSILYDLTTYSAGIYLVKIQGDDNTVFTKKIVLIN
jgi:hypothetical protein